MAQIKMTPFVCLCALLLLSTLSDASASESKSTHGIESQAFVNSTNAVDVARRQLACTTTGTEYVCTNRGYTQVPNTVWIATTTKINLMNNVITFIPVNAFDGLTLMTFLNIANNDITLIPVGMVDTNTALNYFHLGGNKIKSIPAGMVDNNQALKYLFLNDNDISSIPVGMLNTNTALTYLSPRGNPLVCSDTQTWVVGNAISSICTSCTEGTPQTVTCGSAKIDFLRCNSQCVSEPNSESPTVSPTRLSDSACTNENLAPNPPTGTKYYCMGRGYTQVPNTAWIANTTHIYLNENAITSIRVDAFDGLTLMKYLGLHYNDITLIPVGMVDNNPALQELYLINNAITSVPTGLVDNNPILKLLLLSGNPLQCSNFANNWVVGTAISSVCTSCTVGTPQSVTCGSAQIDFWQCDSQCVSEPNSESPVSLTCAKIAVIYSEPVAKTYEMTLSTRQLAGIDAIDSSFALNAGKFAVEVKMTAGEDPNAVCSTVDDDWGVTDINGTVTYGAAVDFYGLTSEHDYFIPVAKSIMVICFETTAAEELDVRDQYHYHPVIASLNSCPQVSIGASCDVDITGATFNKWNDLNTEDRNVYDNDWVQTIEVTSIKDVANNLEIPTKFMFTTSSQDFLSPPVVLAAGQSDVGRTQQRTDNFFSSSKSKFALSQSRGFQKVVVPSTAPRPAVGSFLGESEASVKADCFEVVATKYTGTEMFYIVHNDASNTLNNEFIKNIYYLILNETDGNMVTNPEFLSNPGCSNCTMGELYPVNYEVTINVIGRDGVGRYTTGGSEQVETACTTDVDTSTDCKTATQTFAFTMTDWDVDEVKVGAMIAHAPVSVVDQQQGMYVATAKKYDNHVNASSGTSNAAQMVLTVTDDDFLTTTSSELSKAMFAAGTNVYTEALKVQVTVTLGAQVASAGCSGLDGGCKYLPCPVTRMYTTDTIAATNDNEGLSVTKNVSLYTLTYNPSYACPAGVIGCDDDNKLAYMYYGTQYCTIIAQFSDNTASLSNLSDDQKEEIGIYQTLSDQQGTKHTFLFGATSYSEHDYSVIVSPAVKFAALSRRSFAKFDALTDETWASIQLKTTNRARPNSELNNFPLGRIVAPNNDGNCAPTDHDTNFVDINNDKLCCSRLASTYGTYTSLYVTAAPACDDGSGTCMGDGQCEDSCTQTLKFSLKSPGTAGSTDYPFAEVGEYTLCVVYEDEQFPYNKKASVLSTTIQITDSRRAAREEGEEAQAPPQPQEQSISFDISPSGIMTVRLGSDEETEIVISPGTPQAPAAPTTPSPTPTLTLEGDDTQSSKLSLLGFTFGGILLLIIIVAVAVTMLSRQRKQQSKVYPFWMPGAGADTSPQFTPATSTFTTSV